MIKFNNHIKTTTIRSNLCLTFTWVTNFHISETRKKEQRTYQQRNIVMDKKEKENRKIICVQVSIKHAYFQKFFTANTSNSIFQPHYDEVEEYSA